MADQCTAKAKSTGQRCGKPAIPGGTVCRIHGGATPVIKAAGQRRLAELQAQADVTKFGARRDIHPAEALLELVHWTAGEVDYWRARVALVEAETDGEALAWGKTSHRKGSGPEGPIDVTTHEAKPNVAYAMLERASDRLAQYAAAALKAGVEERRVQLAERQGALVADVIRRVLADLQLTSEQEALVGEVVPRHLRALAGAQA